MRERDLPAPIDPDEPPAAVGRKKRKKKLAGYAAARARVAAEGRGGGRSPSGRTWTTTHVLGALVVGVTGGAIGGYAAHARSVAERNGTAAVALAPSDTPAAAATPAPAPAAPGAPAADKFGRPSGDPHFGHDHPPEQGGPVAPAAPGTGGPDAFGRQPGTEHYNHPHS